MKGNSMLGCLNKKNGGGKRRYEFEEKLVIVYLRNEGMDWKEIGKIVLRSNNSLVYVWGRVIREDWCGKSFEEIYRMEGVKKSDELSYEEDVKRRIDDVLIKNDES